MGREVYPDPDSYRDVEVSPFTRTIKALLKRGFIFSLRRIFRGRLKRKSSN